MAECCQRDGSPSLVEVEGVGWIHTRWTGHVVAGSLLLGGCASKGQLDAARGEAEMLRKELEELRAAAEALQEAEARTPEPTPSAPGRRLSPGTVTIWDPSRDQKGAAAPPSRPVGAVGMVGAALGGPPPSLVWVMLDDEALQGGRSYALDDADHLLGWFPTAQRDRAKCESPANTAEGCALDLRGFSSGEVLAPAASNATLDGAGFDRVETNDDFCGRWASWLVTAWTQQGTAPKARCWTTTALVKGCGADSPEPCAD